MGKFGFNRLIFTNRLHNIYFENFLLRFYEQLISGVWAVLIILPLGELLDNAFNGTHKKCGYCTWKYLLFCAISTSILIISSILLPKIKKIKLRRELYHSLKTDKIKTWQKEKIRNVLNDSLLYKSFFSLEGFWQFIMVNFFNVGVISAYFCVEKFIDFITYHEGSLWPALVFGIIFIVFVIIGWITDNWITVKFIKYSHHHASCPLPLVQSSDHKCDTKPLLVNILKLIAKDSLENKLNQAIIEDAIDDISEILTISTNKDETSFRNPISNTP